ncbi:hypothetical protein [Cohnella sp. WQ 127256]|uniref:hypothetical protein n=1 Tax=Cohnella sp. WQ 127256 TaxID=2938790 RepID=UPI0021185BF9|nr:hypothetical protein [Cohnella sp. WQ 127256]
MSLLPHRPRPKQRIRSLLLVTFVALYMGVIPTQAFAAAAQPATNPHPSKLEQQVQEWVAKLSEQKLFQAWQTADPQIEALGPGTHSWLVLFTKEGKDIGYMVVNAVTDGSFQLGEYGVGPFSLFSQQRLRQSLIDGGFIPSEKQFQHLTTIKHYVHPFATAWEVTIGDETLWFDAKTAEQLPVDSGGWNKMFPATLPANPGTDVSSQIVNLALNEEFDAYEKLPWLTKEAPFSVKDVKKLQKRLDTKLHLRYVTEPFGDAMLYAVPIIGYQRWSNGRMDLAIDMLGTRFIPLDALVNKGLFYR